MEGLAQIVLPRVDAPPREWENDPEREAGFVPGSLNVVVSLPTSQCIRRPKHEVFNESTNYLSSLLPLQPNEELIGRYIRSEGFGDHHIEVFDRWIAKTSTNNVSSRELTFPDGKVVRFENLRIDSPRYTRDGKVLPLSPKLARENGVTYGSDWYVDAVLYSGETGSTATNLVGTLSPVQRIPSVCIGQVPTMLKSNHCVLHGLSPEQLSLYGEDPKDPGGYFIVCGDEKVVLLQEQLAINRILLMDMDDKGSVVARMTANTPRGTALIELAIDKETHSFIEMRFPAMRNTKQGEKYKSLNVLSIFRILGVASAGEIIAMISLFIKKEYVKKSILKLTRNLTDFALFTDDEDHLIALMDKSKLSEAEKRAEVKRVMDSDLFPHLNKLPGPDGETVVQEKERITLAKLYLLAIMIARFLEYLAGFRKLDDRDSWSNKRVEGAGRVMEQLFRKAWGKSLGLTQAAIESGTIRTLDQVVVKIKHDVITDTFRDSFSTSNWGVKGTQTRSNVSQPLSRDSVLATFAHINTVDVGISRTNQKSSIRLVQNGQWGFICPVSTPEGENSGLVKNLALTAKVSLDCDDSDIIRSLIGDPPRIVSRVIRNYDSTSTWTDKIIVNGKFLGWCDGGVTREFLVSERRQSRLQTDMSVVKEGDWVYVDISPSRLVRPLLIVDEEQELLIDKLHLRNAPITQMLNDGAMEYLSAWEQEYIKLATSPEKITERLEAISLAEKEYRETLNNLVRVKAGEIIMVNNEETISMTLGELLEQISEDTSFETELVEIPGNSGTVLMTIGEARVTNIPLTQVVNMVVLPEEVALTEIEANKRVVLAKDSLDKVRKTRPYTHCELAPLAILGVAAALIPWPDHNPAPRNTFQVSMGKQALGVYHSNHLNRLDGKTKILAFSTRPVVETDLYDILGLDDRGPGENISMAFMAFPGSEEDSFVVKKEFLDNGGFRMVKYLTYSTTFKHAGDVIDKLAKPVARQGENAARFDFIHGPESGAAMEGLPKLGAPLKQGDCIIGKSQYVEATKEEHNESIYLRYGDEGIVDMVLVTSDNKTTSVTVKLRVERVPQAGDKFAPRNAQKGTVGVVKMAIDLPCDENGITPDFIVNTHSMPSRMTESYPMEMLAAKHAAFRGVHVNAAAFQPFEMNKYRETMKEYGLNEFGYEFMRSGSTGKPLHEKIYSGPIFFQALKHHVKDKVQVRSIGQLHPQTRQPPKGRGNKGGLRFGEMERDACVSFGASAFLRERLMLASDGYQTVYCRKCGTLAVNNPNTKTYRTCALCKETNSFGTVTIPYAYKLLVNLLAAIGINLRPEFQTSEEYLNNILRHVGATSTGEVIDARAALNEADEGLEDEEQEDEEIEQGEEGGLDTAYDEM